MISHPEMGRGHGRPHVVPDDPGEAEPWHAAEVEVRAEIHVRAREPVEVLEVDETSVQKRYDYVTVVADLARRRVL